MARASVTALPPRTKRDRPAKTAGEDKRKAADAKRIPVTASKAGPKTKAKSKAAPKIKPTPKAAVKKNEKTPKTPAKPKGKDTGKKVPAKKGGKKTEDTTPAAAPKKPTKRTPRDRTQPPPSKPKNPKSGKRKHNEDGNDDEPVEGEPQPKKKKDTHDSATADTSKGVESVPSSPKKGDSAASPKKGASIASPKKAGSVASQLSKAGSEAVRKAKSTVNSVANTVAHVTSPKKRHGSKASALSSAPSNVTERAVNGEYGDLIPAGGEEGEDERGGEQDEE